MEGIAAGKARGLYKGGKPRIDLEEVRRPAAEGMRPAHMARKLGISPGPVYRFLPSVDDGNDVAGILGTALVPGEQSEGCRHSHLALSYPSVVPLRKAPLVTATFGPFADCLVLAGCGRSLPSSSRESCARCRLVCRPHRPTRHPGHRVARRGLPPWCVYDACRTNGS